MSGIAFVVGVFFGIVIMGLLMAAKKSEEMAIIKEMEKERKCNCGNCRCKNGEGSFHE